MIKADRNKEYMYAIAVGNVTTHEGDWWIVYDEHDREVYAVETKATAYGLVRRANKEYGFEWYVRLAPECFVPDPLAVYVVNR